MITSTANAQIKELVRLQKKSRAREAEGVFLAEGARITEEIPAQRIRKVYLSESYAAKYPEAAADERYCKKAEILSDAVFAHVSDTKTPQGILAVVERAQYDMNDILCTKVSAPLVVVLDNLQDPGNLGTIFRTAEAAGATGILMSRDTVDVYNPKVIRSTMGAIFRMPFLYVDDLTGTLKEMQQDGVRIFAAHLEGSRVYDEESYLGGSAFLIGNEGNGLRDEVAACADGKILIPMQGKTESLNAAVAAAVLLFEASRQRRNSR